MPSVYREARKLQRYWKEDSNPQTLWGEMRPKGREKGASLLGSRAGGLSCSPPPAPGADRTRNSKRKMQNTAGESSATSICLDAAQLCDRGRRCDIVALWRWPLCSVHCQLSSLPRMSAEFPSGNLPTPPPHPVLYGVIYSNGWSGTRGGRQCLLGFWGRPGGQWVEPQCEAREGRQWGRKSLLAQHKLLGFPL